MTAMGWGSIWQICVLCVFACCTRTMHHHRCKLQLTGVCLHREAPHLLREIAAINYLGGYIMYFCEHV